MTRSIEVPQKTLELLTSRLASIEQELRAVKLQIRNLYTLGEKEIMVHTVRWVAPLAEVERAGGVVTPLELSWFCRKYGKNPKGVAGYFTGSKPSMRSIGDQRSITEDGLARIRQIDLEYGEDWVDKIPLDQVGDPEVDPDSIIYI
ncbi:MAG: hypothetical protein U1D96_08870 [Eubacteriales bacterium]|nr:hypothetical protein [Bacillota bacterium]MBV1728050.1 hypothetical protein [Desulforudis sp.]MDP3051814.1 hypothetical protein [Eubacteriales bacterium]MDQ7788728.1 hypothetical protein [Clostridia bacterium]MBU4532488.1 hypothetical protein [Bacillota bacterium]